MRPFRKETPKHRKGRKVCKHYKSYKKTLRFDFNNRCGYCNDLDANRIRAYVIDHFVPQKPDGWTHTIPPNKYKNLIYSCPFCNGAKSNKWPTKDESMPNDGVQGFIKPTLKLYAKAFRRKKDGSISVHNNHSVGSYIYDELNFALVIHSLNWRFEKFLNQEKILQTSLISGDPQLQQQLDQIRSLRLGIVDEINSLYNG